MAYVEVTNRTSGAKKTVDASPGKTLIISAQEAAKVIAKRGDIKSMTRDEDDLVILLADGSQIRVQGYFACEPQERQDLSVQETDGAIWVVNFDEEVCAGENGSVAWSYSPLAGSAAAAGSTIPATSSSDPSVTSSDDDGLGAAPLIGLGALAIGGLAAAAGGGSGGSSNPGPGPGNGNGDTTAPDAPELEPTNGTVISGTAEPGSTISLDLDGDGTEDATAMADGDGNFSYEPDEPLDDATEVTATATDEAGNESDPATVVVDASTDTPVIDQVADDVAPVTGVVARNGATNDARPTISGSGAEAGATIQISDGDNILGTTVADSNGEWSFTPATALGEGMHQFVARGTDQLGNVSAPSVSYSITVDTMAPAAPVLDPTEGETITGTAEANSSVDIDIDDDGTVDATVTAGSDGSFSYTPDDPLDDDTEVSATATDAAGNTSNEGSVIVDVGDGTTPLPGAPTITSVTDDVALEVGTIASGDVTNDARPTITGTAQAGATVTIFDGSAILGTTTAGSGGSWSFTPSSNLGEGSHAFTARASNAGGTGPSSASYSVVVDTMAPAAPVLDPTEGETITGTAEANSSVDIDIDDDGTVDATVTAGSDGSFSYTPDDPLDDDTEVSATATDAAGNTSNEGSVIVDVGDGTTPLPGAPTITSVTDDVAPEVGTIASGDVTNDARPTITGTAQAGATVTIFDGSAILGTTTAGSGGSWSFTPSSNLGEGSHAFTARASNAGGTGPSSASYSVVVDTMAPAAPVLDPTEGETITGTAEANSSVDIDIDDDGTVDATVTAGSDGSFSYTPDDPLDDDTEVSATATDAAGNTSNEGSVIVDVGDGTTPLPGAPTITSVTDDVGEDTGPIPDGGSTDDTMPSLSGTAEADATVTIYDNGAMIGQTTANGSGAWTFTPGDALIDGPHAFTATATNGTGTSAPSAEYEITVDTDGGSGTGAPTADIEITAIDEDTPPVGDFQTEDLNPTVSGTLSESLAADEIVEVRINGGPWMGASVSGTNWSYNFGVLAETNHTVDARVINDDDEVGDIDTVQLLIIDTDHAPIVQASDADLLGLISVETLNLIDFNGQAFFAFDPDNDITSVSISYEPLVNLDLDAFTLRADEGLANSLGLQITIDNDPGLLNILAPSSVLTITAIGGGTIDNLAINELLATVRFEQDITLLGAQVLDATSITATDQSGLSDSDNVGNLVDLTLLSGSGVTIESNVSVFG